MSFADTDLVNRDYGVARPRFLVEPSDIKRSDKWFAEMSGEQIAPDGQEPDGDRDTETLRICVAKNELAAEEILPKLRQFGCTNVVTCRTLIEVQQLPDCCASASSTPSEYLIHRPSMIRNTGNLT